jgi:hypothetical protein
VVKLTLVVFASVSVPPMPLGTVTVTLVSGRNPDAGVNVAVAPDTFQFPAIFGEMDGNVVFADSGEEKVNVIGAPPLASRAPPTGDADSRRSDVADGEGAADEADDPSDVLLLSLVRLVVWVEAATAQPVTITAAAVPAVTVIIRCRSSAALTRRTPSTLPKNDKSDSSTNS